MLYVTSYGGYTSFKQGYEMTKDILMQDNTLTILLAKNGRLSSSKRTDHIKNRYFIITDKIGKGEIIIQYCPTGDMWADITPRRYKGPFSTK